MLARFFSKPFFLAVLFWAIFGAILYLVVNLLVMPYLAGKFKDKVKVPVLIRMPPDQARYILDTNRLIYMLDSTGEYSTDVPAGYILTQYPEPGTEVKQGRRIWVRVSKGLKSVELPPLRGLSLRQAEITLQQLGLKMGQVREVRDPAIPAGAVIKTNPPKGSALEKGREVNIELSQGTEAASAGMPSLQGLSLGQVKERINELGLKLGKVSFTRDAKNLPGTVLLQSPRPGADYRGHVVDLVISK